MSYTTMYVVLTDGRVEERAEFRNSWGSAAYVWEEFGARRLGMERPPRPGEGNLRRLWSCYKDLRFCYRDRIVLASTYDQVVCEAAHLADLAQMYEDFSSDYPAGDRVCTLPEQAALMRKLADNKGVIGVCWNQTSVAETHWYRYHDDEAKDYPYNVFIDEDHFWLFDKVPVGHEESA